VNRTFAAFILAWWSLGGLSVAGADLPLALTQQLGYPFRLKHNLTEVNYKDTVAKVLREDPAGVREHLRKVFLSYVVNPEDAKVEIAPTTPAELSAGHFPRIVFEFRRGLFESILVEHLYSEFVDCQLNYLELLVHDRIRLVKQGRIDYLTEIHEADLNKAIFNSSKKLKMRNPKLELREGSLVFSGYAKHGLGHTFVRVDGTMKLVDKNKINFQPNGLKVGVLPMPGFITREVFQRLNPVADLTKLKFSAPPDLIIPRPDKLFILTKALEDRLPPKDDPK
jgi:hypothetical protein